MGKAKLNIPMCAALALLFLTMVSIHLTSGLYARYTATATGSDSARVAKFDVTGSGAGNVTVDCTQADNLGEYLITVNSNSEVAVTYTVTVTFTDSLPGTDFVVTLDNESQLSKSGNLPPKTGSDPVSNEHVLKFEVTNWSGISSGVTGATAQKTLNFKVTIDVQQVD